MGVHPDRARAVGQTIRLARLSRRLRQAELGALVGYSQNVISRLENGHGIGDERMLRAIAEHLDIPPASVGLGGNVFPTAAAHPNLAAEPEVDMKRLEFMRGALGVAAALLFPQVLTEETSRVSLEDVAEVSKVIHRLDTVDNRLGGGHVYELSELLVQRIARVLRTGTYSKETGQALQEALAVGHETAGWFAFDAIRHDDARRHWLECLHRADVGGFGTPRTTVLAHMALQAAQRREGHEAIELAQAAVRDPATPARVRSLLAAREALGHAVLGDRVGSDRLLARSAQLLDRGPGSDDPTWIGFWGPADLACHRSKAALMLGDWASAERAARTASATIRPAGLTRNAALYRVRLGYILARRRALDEAIATVRPLVTAAQLTSIRVRTELGNAVSLIGAVDYRPAREFTDWARSMGVA